MNVQPKGGLVTAAVLAMVLAGLVSGALSGMVLGGLFARHLVLAILCAVVAAILALVIRDIVLGRDVSTVPFDVNLLWVVIASLIGGLAGHELAIDLTEPPPMPLVGALSGLVASVLIASFAITIFMLRNRLSVPDE
jgi:polyferredoxin